jgi:GTP-binding protein
VTPEQITLPAKPEIALVGRSNVGKSSLINALCRQNKLARISASPGKTRMVNFFEINDAFYLVDLPGYGYAKVSQREQAGWGKMIENYLSRSKQLKHLLFLMDIRHEPSQGDKQMAYWLEHYRIPCTIVATKADKVTRSQRKLNADKLSDAVGMTFRTPTIVFSVQEKLGIEALEKRIGQILQQGTSGDAPDNM